MGNVGPREFAWLFLGFRGRIARAPFLLGILFLNLVVAFPFYRAILLPQDHADVAYWVGIASLLSFPAFWSLLALTVKRVHDFGKPGPLAVLIIVPMINFFAFVAFAALPGDPGANAYGRETNGAG